MSSSQVWVIDDDRSIRWVLEKALNQADISTASFADGNDVIKRLEHTQPAAIISDIRMPGIDGLELLAEINQRHPHLPVIITTAHSESLLIRAVRSSTCQNPSTLTMPSP